MSEISDYFERDEILDFISEGLLFMDLSGKIISINRAGARILGYGTPEELIDAGFRDRYRSPKEFDNFIDIMQKTGEMNDYLIFALKRDGKHAYIEAQSRLRKDEKGTPVGIATLFRDVSERELYRRALERAEGRYQQLFNSISEGYVRFAPDNTVIFINPAGAKILGFDSPTNVIGRKLLDHWEDPEKCKAYLKQLEDSGCIVNMPARFRIPGGKIITLEIFEHVVRGRYGQIIGSDALFRDITEEAQLKTELEQSLKLHKYILQNCSELVLAVDRNATILFANDAFARLLGYGCDEVLGKSAYEIAPPEDHATIDTVRSRVREGKSVQDIRVYAKNKNGSLISLSWTAVPVSPALPDGTSAILIATDISELVALQKKISELEKDD